MVGGYVDDDDDTLFPTFALPSLSLVITRYFSWLFPAFPSLGCLGFLCFDYIFCPLSLCFFHLLTAGTHSRDKQTTKKTTAKKATESKASEKKTTTAAQKKVAGSKTTKVTEKKVATAAKKAEKPAAKTTAKTPAKSKAEPKTSPKTSAKNLAMHQRIIQHSLEMANLKPNQCRWPIGDPDSEHFHFCGETVFVGKPYCYEHCKQAYQFTPPKKK